MFSSRVVVLFSLKSEGVFGDLLGFCPPFERVDFSLI